MKDSERWEVKQIAKIISKECIEYFKDPDHQKDFEKWYEKKYEKKYEPTANHRE